MRAHFNKTAIGFLSALAVLLFLCGCSVSGKPNKKNVATVVDVETVPEQALAAVLSTPTEFVVQGANDYESWERARIFFLQYLGASSLKEVESRPGGGRTILSNEKNSSAKYSYRVVRSDRASGGSTYQIVCQPNLAGTSNEAAARNGKNLARFIREGTLEVSLLIK